MLRIWQRNRAPLCISLALVVAAGVAMAEPVPTRYTIQELGTFGGPEECGSMSVASAINELGHAVGGAEHSELIEVDYGDGDIRLQCAYWSHAVLWRDGEMIELEPLFENGFASAKGLNDLDHVVGQAAAVLQDGSGAAIGVPFLWTPEDGMVDLTGGANFHGWAWGINNFDEIATDGNRGLAMFWTEDEGFRTIEMNDPSDQWTNTAWEINNDGVVVGNAAPAGDFPQAYRYRSKSDGIEDLHDPFFWRSGAYGLNENADVAGWSIAYNHQTFGNVWPVEGEPIVLPLGEMIVDGYLRWDLVHGNAEHMNSHGDVVGETISAFPTPPVAWIAFEALDGGPVKKKIPLVDLLSPEDRAKWEITAAMEINDSRQIVGIGKVNDLGRGFIMTPDYSVSADAETSISTPISIAGSGQRFAAAGESDAGPARRDPVASRRFARSPGDGTGEPDSVGSRGAVRPESDSESAASSDRRFSGLPATLRPRSLVGAPADDSPVALHEFSRAKGDPSRSGVVVERTQTPPGDPGTLKTSGTTDPAAPLAAETGTPSRIRHTTRPGAGSDRTSGSGERNEQ